MVPPKSDHAQTRQAELSRLKAACRCRARAKKIASGYQITRRTVDGAKSSFTPIPPPPPTTPTAPRARPAPDPITNFSERLLLLLPAAAFDQTCSRSRQFVVNNQKRYRKAWAVLVSAETFRPKYICQSSRRPFRSFTTIG